MQYRFSVKGRPVFMQGHLIWVHQMHSAMAFRYLRRIFPLERGKLFKITLRPQQKGVFGNGILSSRHSEIEQWMDVSGQCRTPTALSQGRGLWLLLDMRTEGPEVGLYCGTENSLAVQESKPGSPSPY
jgi:hypothetical protein